MQRPFIDFVRSGSIGALNLGMSRSEVLEKLGLPNSWLGKPPCVGPIILDAAKATGWFYFQRAVGVYFDSEDLARKVNVFPDQVRPKEPFEGWPIGPGATMSDFRSYLEQNHVPFCQEPDPDGFFLAHERCVAQFAPYRNGKLLPEEQQPITMVSTVARDEDLPPHVAGRRQREWSLLRTFFAGQLGEKWRDKAANPEDILGIYKAKATSEELRTLSTAILAYLGRFENEDKLKEKLYSELGCWYKPSSEGRSTRTWLQNVASSLLKGAMASKG